MKQPSETIHFVVPGPLDQATGGYRYDAAIVAGLQAAGYHVVVHELAGTFPVVDRQAVAAARVARARIGTGRAVIDGLALPAFAELLGTGARITGLVHHPLWLESGITRRIASDLQRAESALLPRLANIVVTSEATRRDVIALGVDPQAVAVVEPATAWGPPRQRHSAGHTRLLSVGTLTPRKAHDVLFRALARQRRVRWRLLCIGSVSRNPSHARRLRRRWRGFMPMPTCLPCRHCTRATAWRSPRLSPAGCPSWALAPERCRTWCRGRGEYWSGRDRCRRWRAPCGRS
jgi:hypothetical protein